MIRLFIAVILVLSPIQSLAKWFSEPEEIFETERCLGAFIDGAKILNDMTLYFICLLLNIF